MPLPVNIPKRRLEHHRGLEGLSRLRPGDDEALPERKSSEERLSAATA